MLGNIWDVYFGFFVRAIFGFVNTFIGGWKTEIIRGAEIKNIHGIKSELIKGHVFKGHSGREFTLNKSTDIEKAPSLLWQIKQAKHMHDGYVMRCRSNKNEKIAGDAMKKARAIRNSSDEFYVNAKKKVVSKTSIPCESKQGNCKGLQVPRQGGEGADESEDGHQGRHSDDKVSRHATGLSMRIVCDEPLSSWLCRG